MKLTYRDRGIPRWWRNKHWGTNGELDWGEPSWPGWVKPRRFWDTVWPVVIIMAVGLAGWLTIPLFLGMTLYNSR